VEWINYLVLELIKEYRKMPYTCDPSDFKCKLINNKNHTWKEIADVFECGSIEIRKRLN
jgi:hypothetical protein